MRKKKKYYADLFSLHGDYSWRIWAKQGSLICCSNTYTRRNSAVRGLMRFLTNLGITKKVDLSAIERGK